MQIGGLNWSEHYPLLATVVVPVGNVSFIASVEDSSYSGGTDNGVNFVGAINYENGFGNARLSGAVVDSLYGSYGYALNLNAELKPTDKLSVTLGGHYLQNASGLVYLSPDNYGDVLFDTAGDAVALSSFDELNSTAYSV